MRHDLSPMICIRYMSTHTHSSQASKCQGAIMNTSQSSVLAISTSSTSSTLRLALSVLFSDSANKNQTQKMSSIDEIDKQTATFPAHVSIPLICICLTHPLFSYPAH